MKIQTHRSALDLAAALAQDLAAAIARKPDLVFGLPAGRTPVALYRELVEVSRAQALDWSRVRTFNLDELVTSDPGALRPYQRFIRDHLLALVNVSPALADSPDGGAPSLEAECDRYETAIASAGGLDLVLLGIGANGHIGFNEPRDALAARTHVATLSPASRAANAWLFGDRTDRVPATAVSMGMATILGARSVVLVATGAAKAAAVSAMVHGGITTAVPASFLQLHADVTILLDDDAAGSWGRA